MSETLILEFTGVGQVEYDSVNGKLGIDMDAGSGDWPPGLLMHSAGTSERGTLVVAEVWASRDAQETFRQERLGAALAAAGVTARPTVTWVPLFSYQTPGS
jgi:hypothetical protein